MATPQQPADPAASLIGSQLHTYQTLINMGFAAAESVTVAQIFGSNAEGAINCVLSGDAAKFSAPIPRPLEPKLPSKIPKIPEEYIQFRITRISQILMAGYIRSSQNRDIIPTVIKDMIIKYFNFYFIKLNYNIHDNPNQDNICDQDEKKYPDSDILRDEHDTIFVVKENTTLRRIAIELEARCKDNYDYHSLGDFMPYVNPQHYSYFVHVWINFRYLKRIYPLNNKHMKINMSQIEAYHNHNAGIKTSENINRWVEVPNDFEEVTLCDIDKLVVAVDKQSVLHLGIERFDAVNQEWPFRNTKMTPLPHEISPKWKPKRVLPKLKDILIKFNTPVRNPLRSPASSPEAPPLTIDNLKLFNENNSASISPPVTIEQWLQKANKERTETAPFPDIDLTKTLPDIHKHFDVSSSPQLRGLMPTAPKGVDIQTNKVIREKINTSALGSIPVAIDADNSNKAQNRTRSKSAGQIQFAPQTQATPHIVENKPSAPMPIPPGLLNPIQIASISSDADNNTSEPQTIDAIQQIQESATATLSRIARLKNKIDVNLNSKPIAKDWKCVLCNKTNDKTHVICGGCFVEKEEADYNNKKETMIPPMAPSPSLSPMPMPAPIPTPCTNWTQYLQIGDIVDAKDEQDKWYEAVIRFILEKEDKKLLYIHYVGWNKKWDEILNAYDFKRISKRNTKTSGPHRPKKSHYSCKPDTAYPNFVKVKEGKATPSIIKKLSV